MAEHSQGPNGLVPVHVAVHNPAEMSEPDPQAADYAHQLFAASVKYTDISWSESGAEPRWLDMDTSTCAAAINPSHFASRGADEFERFLSGAASRGEPALIIATMGNADDNGLRNVFSRYNASVHFHHFTGSIAGKRLPAGADISLAPDLDAADRDLGLRLRNRPADAPWWAMALQAMEGSRGTTVHEPEGELVPILVDSLGEPVVTRWTPSDGQQIWYVIPDAVDWDTVVWANPIEAHFGPLRQFTLANSHHPNHTVQTRALHTYLRWCNANTRHPDVLTAQRRERARIRSEKGMRWGGRPLANAA